jgi:hypothetical protein
MYSTDVLYVECCEEFQLLHHCSNHKIQDVSFGQMHEETITQNEALIEHVVSSLEIAENILMPSNVHDNLVVLNVAKEFFLKKIINRLRRILLPIVVMKHMIFMGYFKENKKITTL